MTTENHRSPITLREAAALAAILALAAVLRLGWPGLTEFKADEAHLFTLALDMAEFKSWPLCGIWSSVGPPNSPVSVYLTALPLALPFMRNPIGGVLWVGALNTISVLLCYAIGRRYWGVPAGLIAALLFAAAPWAVIYSRKIWEQDYLPLFTLAYIGSALLAIVDGRRRWIAAHLALLPVLAQLHLSALALAPLSALILVIYRRWVDWRWVAAGVGLAAVACLPYVQCLSATGTGYHFLDLLGKPAQLTLDSVTLAWLVAVGEDIHSLAGPNAFREYLASVPNAALLWALVGALIVGGLVYWVSQAVRRRSQPASVAGLICALWLVMPTLFFLRHSTSVFPHYFIVILPAPYLAAGALLGAVVQKWKRPWAAGLAFGVPLIIAGMQAALFLDLLHFLATHYTRGGFGTPVQMTMDVARGVTDRLAETGAGEVLVVSDGDDPVIYEIPAVFDVLLRGVPHRFVNGDYRAVLPAGGAVVLFAPGDWKAQATYETWAEPETPVETIPLRPGEGAYRVLTLAAGVPAAPPHPAQPVASLANGVRILGYDWSGQAQPGGQIAWALWWRVDGGAAPEASPYHIFSHLVDGSGAQWGQEDEVALVTANWRPGDVVVSFFGLPVAADAAPGPYWVQAGMYTYPDTTNVPVLDAAGLPASDSVRLGPLAGP